MTRVYTDGTYLANNPGWHEEDSAWKAERVDRLIRRHRLHPKTICEIGCGAGGVLSNLSHRYGRDVDLCGYEVSPQAYELCRRKSKSNLTFILGNLLEDNTAHFDIVMAIDVVEHVEDYMGFLRSLRGKAEYKILHIPLDLSVQTVLRSSPITKVRRKMGHLHYFTKETALETLTDTGYTIVDYCYTGASVRRSSKGWRAGTMRLPRKLAFAISRDLAVRVLGGFSLLVLAR